MELPYEGSQIVSAYLVISFNLSLFSHGAALSVPFSGSLTFADADAVKITDAERVQIPGPVIGKLNGIDI